MQVKVGIMIGLKVQDMQLEAAGKDASSIGVHVEVLLESEQT